MTQHVDPPTGGPTYGGLRAALKHEEHGERDVADTQKARDAGGTQPDNTYHGAAHDETSAPHNFSFAPNPDWSMSYSPQPEIQAYIQRVARESGVLDRFVFDTLVADAAWDDETQRWVVQAEGPTGTTTYAARTVIAGPGGLSEPR